MNETFLKIEHELFDAEKNIFELAGTEGFTLYCTLLYHQANSPSIYVRLKDIQTFLTREYDKRPSIIYSKNKTNQISCLKDKKTLAKYLKTLVRLKLINILNLTDIVHKHNSTEDEFNFEYINATETLLIKVDKLETDKGWNGISTELFEDYIHKLGHIGWSILCLLSKLHNINYSNTLDGGFANPTEEYMCKVLNRNESTISAYLYLLDKLKLIKIIPQEPIYKVNKYGMEELCYIPNHYIVKHKINGEKYFLKDLVSKEKENN
jgi:hypothetical protein